MSRSDRVGIVLVVGLLVILVLTGCGKSTPTATPVEGLPSSAEEHFERGNELTQAGEFEQAVYEYEQALEKEPDNVDALIMLGVAYYSLEQLDKSIEQYSKAIEIAPNDADIHSNLAAAYVQQSQLTGSAELLNEGLEEYQVAVDLDPSLPEAHYGLGVVYVLLNQPNDAIQAFEKFQELDTGKDPMATQSAEDFLAQLRGQ